MNYLTKENDIKLSYEVMKIESTLQNKLKQKSLINYSSSAVFFVLKNKEKEIDTQISMLNHFLLKRGIKEVVADVFLHDLSATYCNFFFESNECDYLNKNNLAEDEGQFSINNYDIYIPKLEYPFLTTQSNVLKKYTMSNDVTFLDFIKLNKINSNEQ